MCERIFANPSEAEASRRYADLSHREVLAHMVDDQQRAFGRFFPLPCQLFQAGPTHPNDGELRGYEHPVRKHECESGED